MNSITLYRAFVILFASAIAVAAVPYMVSAAFSFTNVQNGYIGGTTPTHTVSVYSDWGMGKPPNPPYGNPDGNWYVYITSCANGSCSSQTHNVFAGTAPDIDSCEDAAAYAGLSENTNLTCVYTFRQIWPYNRQDEPLYCYDYTCGATGPWGVEQTYEFHTGIRAPTTSTCPSPPPGKVLKPSGWHEWHEVSCNVSSHTGAPTVPTATLSAAPATVVAGNSSALTHACTNSTSATISSIGTVSSTSGTSSVAPTSTATYTLTCTGAGGSATASTTVTVIPTLTASCSVSPTSITAGGSATWTAAASGGTGTYAYSWSGTDGLSGTSNPVSKAYTTAGTKTASVTVTSGTQSVTQACGNSLTVNPVAQSDLTAGGVSVSGTTAGSPSTFTASATNIGAGSSGAFPLLFQVENPASLQNSSYLAGLASGASAPGSVSHTFASAGTYNVRACANYNTSWTAIVTESNYSNNCGPWTPVTISPPAPTGSLSCSVSNTAPPPGTSVTYTVTPSNGASGPYTWNDQQGGSYGSSASVSRLIPGAGPYVMFVSGQNVISQPVSCPAVGGACVSSSAIITANPTRVRQGETTTVTWSASGIDGTCTVTGPGVSQTVTAASCVVPQGTATPTITTQSVYRISCDGGEATDEVIVNLIPEFIEF